MKYKLYYIGFLIVIILLIIYWYYCTDYQYFINGFWEANSTYCEMADIDNMYLYIDEYNGYVYSEKDGEELFTLPLIFNYSKLRTKNLFGSKIILNNTLTYDENENFDWPENIIMEFDIIDGSLKITDSDKKHIYGYFYKNYDV